MSVITIDHHRSAHACCTNCPDQWRTSEDMRVEAVLSRAAEHAIMTGHTVTEHTVDDAVVHPLP